MDSRVPGGAAASEHLKESIRVSPKRETLYGKSVSSRVKRFSRVPLAVYADKSLSFCDHTAYGLIACTAISGPMVTIGMRSLGEQMELSAATVMRIVKRLVAAGHLEVQPQRRGQRAVYRLTSPIFETKADRLSGPVEAVKPTLKNCGRCQKPKRVNRTGLCEKCREVVAFQRGARAAKREGVA